MIEAGEIVGGGVTLGVDDCSVDGGALDVAMSEQFGYGVEVGSSHQCHRCIAVTCGVESDMFVNLSTLRPLCECLFYGSGGWQGEYVLVGTSFKSRKPSDGIGVDFIGDGLLRLLHDDGVTVVIAHFSDVTPSDVSYVAQAKSCETAEEEGLLDHLIETWGVGKSHNFVDMKVIFDDEGALWHVAASHVHDGVGEDGLFNGGFRQHALEGTEVMVGTDTREPFPVAGSCVFEVFREPLTEADVNVSHL